jgi:hypothetical protein
MELPGETIEPESFVIMAGDSVGEELVSPVLSELVMHTVSTE